MVMECHAHVNHHVDQVKAWDTVSRMAHDDENDEEDSGVRHLVMQWQMRYVDARMERMQSCCHGVKQIVV